MIIQFIPQRFLAFKYQYPDLFDRYKFNLSTIVQSAITVFNHHMFGGGVKDMGELRVVVNNRTNLYRHVEKQYADYVWEIEGRFMLTNELSDMYDRVLVVVNMLFLDMLNSQQKVLAQPHKVADVRLTPLGGEMYVQ